MGLFMLNDVIMNIPTDNCITIKERISILLINKLDCYKFSHGKKYDIAIEAFRGTFYFFFNVRFNYWKIEKDTYKKFLIFDVTDDSKVRICVLEGE